MSTSAVPPLRLAPPRRPAWRSYLGAVVWVAGSALLAALLERVLDVSSLTMVFLFGMVGVATTCGRGPAVFASVCSVAAFDFLFVPPRFTFWVEDPRAWLTFAVLLVVGLALSTMTLRLRDEAEAARRSEARLAALYALSRETASMAGPADLPDTVARVTAEVSGWPSVLLLPDAEGRLTPRAGAGWAAEGADADAAAWTFARHFPSGCGTPHHEAAQWLYLPFVAGGKTLGVLGVRPAAANAVFAQVPVLQALANQAAQAMETLAT